MQQLEGRVAVVTGGGSGIGAGIVGACAEARMRIVVADIELEQAQRVADAVREGGGEAVAVAVDVSQRLAVDELAERAYATFGAVHLLCNNAGVIMVGPVAETTPADWQWVFSVNVFGVVHGIQAFVPRMREQGGEAHIVNTASLAGITATAEIAVGTYTASKHAVIGLSEILRQELEPDQIGVSVLCPGGVATRLFTSDRNLPPELRGEVTPAVPEREDVERMDPREVGERVLEAVRANRYYVITHPGTRRRVEERYETLLAAYDEAAGR